MSKTAADLPSSPDTNPALEVATQSEYRRERRLRARDLALAVLTPVVLLALWEVAALAGALDARLFTPPSAIAGRAWQMISDGELWQDAVATIARLSVGFVVGSALGVLTGLLMGVSRPLRAALGPTFTSLYALPKIAILPLLLLIFGLTETPKVLSVAISVVFVVQINSWPESCRSTPGSSRPPAPTTPPAGSCSATSCSRGPRPRS